MPIKRLTVAAALVSMLLVAGSLQAKVTTTAKIQSTTDTHVVAKTHAAVKTHTTAKPHAAAKTHNTSKTHAVAKAHVKARTRSVAKAHTKAHAHSTSKSHATTRATAKAQPQTDLAAGVVTAKSATVPSPLSPESTFYAGSSVLLPASAAAVDAADQNGNLAEASTPDNAANVTDLRKALIGLAMDLRDTRYVRGGRDPSTGFDCSGFVRYVFAHAIGMKLPTNSASQFLAGLKVDRADMKPGDLVFFQTGRKRHISHVGIYLSNGRFIHSPATGKTVQVSSLSESYWAKHFAGAKRPSGIVAAARNG